MIRIIEVDKSKEKKVTCKKCNTLIGYVESDVNLILSDAENYSGVECPYCEKLVKIGGSQPHNTICRLKIVGKWIELWYSDNIEKSFDESFKLYMIEEAFVDLIGSEEASDLLLYKGYNSLIGYGIETIDGRPKLLKKF